MCVNTRCLQLAMCREVTTRWTMGMQLTLSPIKSLWNPRLVFTGENGGWPGAATPRLLFLSACEVQRPAGTSIMGINPATRRFNSHRDTWDAVQQQQYFSSEAFLHMLVRKCKRECHLASQS